MYHDVAPYIAMNRFIQLSKYILRTIFIGYLEPIMLRINDEYIKNSFIGYLEPIMLRIGPYK